MKSVLTSDRAGRGKSEHGRSARMELAHATDIAANALRALKSIARRLTGVVAVNVAEQADSRHSSAHDPSSSSSTDRTMDESGDSSSEPAAASYRGPGASPRAAPILASGSRWRSRVGVNV